MPTYRVYLRRPIIPEPIWDWAQTVVAPNEQTALGRSYQSWIDSRPRYIIPPLSQCESMVNRVGQTNILAADIASEAGQQEFVDVIQKKVSKALETKLDGAFRVVSYPSGFNYGITYGNNAYYNEATLKDIDTLLGTSSSGGLCLTGAGFSTLYSQILPAVTFSFSQQNQKTMNDQDTAASAQVASILQEFQNAGGVIPPDPGFGGKLGYVFDYLIDKYGALDKIPDTLNALRNAIFTYKAQAADSYALHNRWSVANARLAAAYNNVVHPSAENGGQQIDATRYYVGFNPKKLPSANQLIGSLQTETNAIKVEISMSHFSSETAETSISGGVSFKALLAALFTVSVSSSASYNLSRYTSSKSTVSMELTYPGLTLFSAMPSELSANNKEGWYANEILHEVVANTGQDGTGYKLQGDEFHIDELFGEGQTFSRLKTFVISQEPTIKLTLANAEVSKIESDFKKNTSVAVKLFGLFTIGSHNSSYHVHDIETDSKTSTVTVTFGPPKVSGTIPLEQQVAYVLGGVASYPPDHI